MEEELASTVYKYFITLYITSPALKNLLKASKLQYINNITRKCNVRGNM